MTRRTLILGLFLAVVLAGCTTGPTGTTTPAPTTDAPATAASPEAIPGVTNGAVTNDTALARANEAMLAEAGGEILTRRADPAEEVEYRVTVGEDIATYALSTTHHAGEETGAIDLWSNETTRFARMQVDGETRFRTAGRESGRLNSLEVVETYLSAGQFTVRNESADGPIEFTADEVVPPEDGHGPLADVSSFSGRLVVEESGLIRNLTISAVQGGETVTYRYALVQTGVGRVAQPTWVDDVPASATLHPEVDVTVENNSYLVLRNTGTDPVPRNSSIALTTDGTTAVGTFETELETGDVLYVAFEDAGQGLRVTARRPDGGVGSITSPASVTITTEDGVTLLSMSMGWDSESASSEGGGSSSGSASQSG